MKSWVVAAEDERLRVDRFIADHAGCSRAEARRLLDEGLVRVDGARAKKGLLLRAGARVELAGEPVTSDEGRQPVPQPELPLEIVYLDDAILGLVKPIGMASHPLKPGERGTLANALVARHPECGSAGQDPREGGLAHRLDGDTSGILLAARTRADWEALRRAFSEERVEKEYWALVTGDPPEHGTVEVPLRQAGKLVKPIPAGGEGALSATTGYRVMARGRRGQEALALLDVSAHTGRMHQIRAHLAFIGHPLVGDALYGGAEPIAGAPGHFLHAAKIRFPHPRTGQEMELRAPLPAERAKALQELLGWSED